MYNEGNLLMHPLELLHPRNLKLLTGHLDLLIRTRLWLKMVIAMFFGVGTGVVLGPTAGLVRPQAALLAGSWLALPSGAPRAGRAART